jgi:6-phosphogluconolactonase
VPIAAKAASLIWSKLQAPPHPKLTITLTDERYVPLNHPDSNWHQLLEKGLRIPGAELIPILEGNNRATTTEKFNNILRQELNDADFKIGLFGIGRDGHTAGILPMSKALESKELACAYDTEKFERITITPKVIVQLDEIIAFAKGEEKWQAIENLQKEIDISKEPAQILKQVPLFTLFTDYIKK